MERPANDPIEIIWKRLGEVESKTDGMFSLAISLLETLLDKGVLTTDDIRLKLGAMFDSLHEPAKNSHTGLVLRVAIDYLRDSNPTARKVAILRLIEGGKSEAPEAPD